MSYADGEKSSRGTTYAIELERENGEWRINNISTNSELEELVEDAPDVQMLFEDESKPTRRSSDLFPILTLRELTNRQKYLQNRQMLSGRKEQHILFMDKNNGSETLHASMCFGNKNAESFWDQDIPAGGSSKKVWTANEFGKFYINFTSNPHGLNLDGTVSVRVSSNKSDLS